MNNTSIRTRIERSWFDEAQIERELSVMLLETGWKQKWWSCRQLFGTVTERSINHSWPTKDPDAKSDLANCRWYGLLFADYSLFVTEMQNKMLTRADTQLMGLPSHLSSTYCRGMFKSLRFLKCTEIDNPASTRDISVTFCCKRYCDASLG